MPKKCLTAILFLLCCLSAVWLSAQVVVVSPTASPETLVACGEAGNFQVVMTNTGNVGFGNSLLTVDLPQGMYYVPGSVTGPVQESDISDPERPVFLMPGFPSQSFREVGFLALIDCGFVNDEPVRYTLLAGGQTYQASEQPLANYFYPEVVITQAENAVLTMPVNSIGERVFTIIQSTPGARLDTLFFVNRYDAGLELLGLSAGDLIGSGPMADTFAITGADLPGGDGFFDFGDTLIVSEQVRLLECIQKNSVIELFWRCGDVVCQTFTLNTLVTPSSGVPNLQIVNQTPGINTQAQANDPQHVGGGFCDTLTLNYEIANNGSETDAGAGTIYDLVVALGLNNNLYANLEPIGLDNFPNWRIMASINGVDIPLGNYHFPTPNPLLGYNIRFDQLGVAIPGMTDADGDGFSDDLPNGAALQIQVRIVYDASLTPDCSFLSSFPNSVGGETVLRMGYQYSNQCGAPSRNWYAVTDPGINVVSLFTHRTGAPAAQLQSSNLAPGQSTWLNIRPDGAWRSPCGDRDSLVLELVLPAGLVAMGASTGPGTHYGIVAQRGDTIWLAGTERGSLTQPWRLLVSADCDVPVIGNSVQMSFLYFCDPACPVYKRIDCQILALNFLTQCQSLIQGIGTRGFEVERRTLGWTDVQHSAKVNPATDPTINLKAAINYDSVEIRLTGVYEGAGPFDNLSARINYRPVDLLLTQPDEPHFLPLGVAVQYFPAGGGELLCQTTALQTTFDGTTNTHGLELALAPLFEPGACLQGITQQAGDSIALSLFVLVSDNTPRRALPVPNLTGEFFSIINGEIVSYNRHIDNFVLEGVVPNANVQYLPQTHYGCEAVYFNSAAVTNKGHFYDGDQFPNEVRSAADVSEIRIRVEGAWGILAGSSQLTASGSFDENDGASASAPGITINIAEPGEQYDGTHTTFIYTNPGNWPRGDMVIGGSNAVHNIQFRAVPGCTVPSQGNFTVAVEADMIRYPYAPIAWRDTITAVGTDAAKSYRRQQAELLLASVQEFIPVSDTITWDFRLNNTTSYPGVDKAIQYGWIAIEGAVGINTLLLMDISNPANPIIYPSMPYGSTGYWFQVGASPAFSSRLFRLLGTYENCEPRALQLQYGFSCLGYPTPDPAAGYPLAGTAYACPAVARTLLLNPTDVSLALNVQSPPSPSLLCEALDYELLITNLQLPNAYQNRVELTIPPGSYILPGSAQLEYPTGSGNWINLPQPLPLGGQTWQWDLSQVPGFPAWVSGVNRAPANQYRIAFQLQTNCSLTSGLRLGFRVAAANACGNVAARTVFSERLTIAGVPAITNNYALSLQAPDGGLKACDTSALQATVLNLGPFSSSDVEFVSITLPQNFEVIPASAAGTVLLADNADGTSRRLRFSLPNGLPQGETATFQFMVRDNRSQFLDCGEVDMVIASLLETAVFCGNVASDTCDLLTVLNADTLRVPILKRSWAADVLDWHSVPAQLDGEWISATVRLSNLAAQSTGSDSLTWRVYFDTDGDGSINPAVDSLIGSFVRPLPPLLGFGSALDTFSFYAPTQQVCSLLLSVANTGVSCLCETFVSATPPVPALRNAGLPPSICSGTSTPLGSDFRTDHITYAWESIGLAGGTLSDPTAPVPVFTADNNTETLQTYTYQLTTLRAGGCSSRDTVAVNVLPTPRAAAMAASDYSGYAVSCAGASDGAAAISMTVGTAPATYQLGQGPAQSAALFEGLAAGEHEFYITDAHGCLTSAVVLLTEPDSLVGTAAASAVTCHGGQDGTATAVATGGVAPYTFLWSNGQMNSTGLLSNQSQGQLGITVTDANGCTATMSTTVPEPPPLSYQLHTWPASCDYRADGAAAARDLQGGTAPYTVLWGGQILADSIHNLPMGHHTVSIADAQGCVLADTFDIAAPPPVLVALVGAENTSCNNVADGSLAIAASGGTPGYSYLWSHGDTTAQPALLPAGQYSLTVTDANACTYTFDSFGISSPPALVLQLSALVPVSCYGFDDGSASVQASGGTGPYSYTWQQGQVTPNAAELSAGTYLVTATDSQGCQDSLQVLVPQPPPLSLVTEVRSPGCDGQPGYLWLAVQGGTPAYQYALNGQAWQADALFRIPAGTYSVLVQDAQGCQLSAAAVLVPPPLPISVELPEVVRTDYGNTVSTTAVVLNATGTLDIHWWPQPAGLSCTDYLSPTFDLTETTLFLLRVVDENGCEEMAQVLVIVDRPRRVYIPNAFSPDGDGINDRFFPYGGPELVSIGRMEIYDRWGNQVFKNEDFVPGEAAQGWDGHYRQQAAKSDVYVYFVEAVFSDGLRKMYKGDVNLLR